MNRTSIRPGHSARAALATTILTLAALPWNAGAQFEITVGTGSTAQDFDTLITAGTNQAWSNDLTVGPGVETLDGWSLFNSLNTAISDYNAGAGGSTTGKFYSFGTGTDTERALGGLGSGGAYFGSPASGALAGYIAFAATNSTALTLTSFTLGFDGEQWRNGGNTTAQTMTLEYGFGTLFTDVTTWIAPGGNFNWTSPVATATAAAVDGNAAGLVTGRGGTANGLNWAAGETLWLRWIEVNDTGNDHGLAIDNFSLSWVAGPPPKDLLWTPTTADWNTIDTNWKDTSNNNVVAFSNGDTVTFDGTGLVQSSVTVQPAGVSPAAVTVYVAAPDKYTISGGPISASPPLQKQGDGTLELGSAYTGGLSAAAGTVKTLANEVFGDSSSVTLGNNATLDLNGNTETVGALDVTGATITTGAGTLTAGGNITVQESPTNTATTIGGTLSVGTGIKNLTIADSLASEDLIINAAITGSARIALFGPGTVRLNGDNSAYSGNFQFNSGPAATVVVGSADAPFGTNTIFLNGGVIRAAVPLTGADKLVNGISFGGSGATIEGENVEIGGTVSFFQGASKVLLINGSTTVTLSGVIENGTGNPNASLAIAGTGTMVMAADGTNYTGAFQVGDFSATGGKVVLASENGLGSGPVTLYAFLPDEVELDVAVSATIGGLNSIGDGGKVVLGQGLPGGEPIILTLNPTLDAFYDGAIETLAGKVGGVVKDGAAEQTLSGRQDYDTLEVLKGTLHLDDSLAGATITSSGGTLNIRADQTLPALNIGPTGHVVVEEPVPAPLAEPGLDAGEPAQAIPEPGALTLLAAGALAMLSRRRR